MSTPANPWQSLGQSGNPVPGNIDVLKGIQSDFAHLQNTASYVSSGLDRFLQTAGSGGFEGQTADALRNAISGRLKTFIDNIAAAFGEADAAMGAYISTLSGAQTTVNSAYQAASSATATTDLTAQQNAVNGASSDVSAAAQKLEAALGDAANKVSQPIEVPSFWHKFWKGFWTALEFIGGALAIISSVIDGPVGLAAGLAAFAAGTASLIKTAVDFAHGHGSVLGLGLSILGVLMPGGKGFLSLKDIGAGLKALAGGAKGALGAIGRGAVHTLHIVTNPAALRDAFVFGLHNTADFMRFGAGRFGSAALRLPGLLSSGAAKLPGMVKGLVGSIPGLIRNGYQIGKTALLHDFAAMTAHLSTGLGGRMGIYALTLTGRFALAALTPMRWAEMAALGFRGGFTAMLKEYSVLLPKALRGASTAGKARGLATAGGDLGSALDGALHATHTGELGGHTPSGLILLHGTQPGFADHLPPETAPTRLDNLGRRTQSGVSSRPGLDHLATPKALDQHGTSVDVATLLRPEPSVVDRQIQFDAHLGLVRTHNGLLVPTESLLAPGMKQVVQGLGPEGIHALSTGTFDFARVEPKLTGNVTGDLGRTTLPTERLTPVNLGNLHGVPTANEHFDPAQALDLLKGGGPHLPNEARVTVPAAPEVHVAPVGSGHAPATYFEAVTGGVGGRIGAERIQAWNAYQNARQALDLAGQHAPGSLGHVSPDLTHLDNAGARLDRTQAQANLRNAEAEMHALGMNPAVIESRISLLPNRVSAPTATTYVQLPGENAHLTQEFTHTLDVPQSGHLSDLLHGMTIQLTSRLDRSGALVTDRVLSGGGFGSRFAFRVDAPPQALAGHLGEHGFSITETVSGRALHFDSTGSLRFRDEPVNAGGFQRFDVHAPGVPAVHLDSLGTPAVHGPTAPTEHIASPAEHLATPAEHLAAPDLRPVNFGAPLSLRAPMVGIPENGRLADLFGSRLAGIPEETFRELPLTSSAPAFQSVLREMNINVRVFEEPGSLLNEAEHTFQLVGPRGALDRFSVAPVQGRLAERLPGGFTVTDTAGGSRFHFSADSTLHGAEVGLERNLGTLHLDLLGTDRTATVLDGAGKELHQFEVTTLDSGHLKLTPSTLDERPLEHLVVNPATGRITEETVAVPGARGDLLGEYWKLDHLTGQAFRLDAAGHVQTGAFDTARIEHPATGGTRLLVGDAVVHTIPDRLGAAVDQAVNVHSIVPSPVWRDTAEALYRYDDRTPSTIFEQGFAPKAPQNTWLRSHVKDDRPSAFVSTTDNPDLDFNAAFKFEIHAPGGIDANRTLGDNMFAHEREISFPGGVQARYVKGAWENTNPNPAGRFIEGKWTANPHFDPGSVNEVRALSSASPHLDHLGSPGGEFTSLEHTFQETLQQANELHLPQTALRPVELTDHQQSLGHLLQADPGELHIGRIEKMALDARTAVHDLHLDANVLHEPLRTVRTQAYDQLLQDARQALNNPEHLTGDFRITPLESGHFDVVHTPTGLRMTLDRSGGWSYREHFLGDAPGSLAGLKAALVRGPLGKEYQLVGDARLTDRFTVVSARNANQRVQFTVTEKATGSRFAFGADGTLVTGDVKLAGNLGRIRFDMQELGGAPRLFDSVGRASDLFRAEPLGGGRIALQPVGDTAPHLERTVVGMDSGRLLEETVPVRDAAGHFTGDYWRVDHTTGQALRLDESGAVLHGLNDRALLQLPGDGRMRLLGRDGTPLFEHPTAAPGVRAPLSLPDAELRAFATRFGKFDEQTAGQLWAQASRITARHNTFELSFGRVGEGLLERDPGQFWSTVRVAQTLDRFAGAPDRIDQAAAVAKDIAAERGLGGAREGLLGGAPDRAATGTSELAHLPEAPALPEHLAEPHLDTSGSGTSPSTVPLSDLPPHAGVPGTLAPHVPLAPIPEQTLVHELPLTLTGAASRYEPLLHDLRVHLLEGESGHTFELAGPYGLPGHFVVTPLEGSIATRFPGGFTIADTRTGDRFLFTADGRLAMAEVTLERHLGTLRMDLTGPHPAPEIRNAMGSVARGFRTEVRADGLVKVEPGTLAERPLEHLVVDPATGRVTEETVAVPGPRGDLLGEYWKLDHLTGQAYRLDAAGHVQTGPLDRAAITHLPNGEVRLVNGNRVLFRIPNRLRAAIDRSVNLHGIVPRPMWRETREALFRFDDRGPETVFKDGFVPRDVRRVGLATYVSSNHPAAFVSTTVNSELDTFPKAFKYEIHAPGGIDVNRSLADNRFEYEKEIAFAGGVHTRYIKGAWENAGSSSFHEGRWIDNPHFDPGSFNNPSFSARFGGFHAHSLSADHLSEAGAPLPFDAHAAFHEMLRQAHDLNAHAPVPDPARVQSRMDLTPSQQALAHLLEADAEHLHIGRIEQLVAEAKPAFHDLGLDPSVLHRDLMEIREHAYNTLLGDARQAVQDFRNAHPVLPQGEHTIGDFRLNGLPNGHVEAVHAETGLRTVLDRNGGWTYREHFLGDAPHAFSGLKLAVTRGPLGKGYQLVGADHLASRFTVTSAQDASRHIQFTAVEQATGHRFTFTGEGTLVASHVPLEGGIGELRFSPAEAGPAHLIDPTGTASDLVRAEELGGGRIALLPTGENAAPFERTVFSAGNGRLLEETVPVRDASGRLTGGYWRIDHTTGLARRLDASGAPLHGAADHALVHLPGDGRVRLLGHDHAPLFEHTTLAPGERLPGMTPRITEGPLHGVPHLADHRLRLTDTPASPLSPASRRLELVGPDGHPVPGHTVQPRESGGFTVTGPSGTMHFDSGGRFAFRELPLPGSEHLVRVSAPAGFDGPREVLNPGGLPVDGARLARDPGGLTVHLPVHGAPDGGSAVWRFGNDGRLLRQELPLTGHDAFHGLTVTVDHTPTGQRLGLIGPMSRVDEMTLQQTADGRAFVLTDGEGLTAHFDTGGHAIPFHEHLPAPEAASPVHSDHSSDLFSLDFHRTPSHASDHSSDLFSINLQRTPSEHSSDLFSIDLDRAPSGLSRTSSDVSLPEHFFSESVPIRYSRGRLTGDTWRIDPESGKAVRLDRNGIELTGRYDTAKLEKSPAGGGMKLVGEDKLVLFEREPLKNGHTLDVHWEPNGRARWTEFDRAGTPVRTGDRTFDQTQRSYHDRVSGTVFTFDRNDVRHYTKAADGGLVRAEKGADGRWTWQRFDAGGKEVLSGDRHWSWSGTHVGFKDVYRDPESGAKLVAQRRGDIWGLGTWYHSARQYKEYVMHAGGARVDHGVYTAYGPVAKVTETSEKLAGGSVLKVKRFSEQRVPAAFWKGRAGGHWYDGFFKNFFSGDSVNRVHHWTERAPDGGVLRGVRVEANDKSWRDIDQYGRVVRESRKTEGGRTIEYGRNPENVKEWAPAPAYQPGQGYTLPWHDTTEGGLSGTRYVDTAGRWEDAYKVDGTGEERLIMRAQNLGFREYLAEHPPRGIAADDRSGVWVDKTNQVQIIARRDHIGDHYVEAHGSSWQTRWRWKAYAQDDPTRLVDQGVRRQSRGSMETPVWDDSFKDFDQAGRLIRERNATDLGSTWVDAVKLPDGGWQWKKFEDGGATLHSEGVRTYHGDPAKGHWSDTIDGVEVRRFQGRRVREFDYTLRPTPPPSPTHGTLSALLAHAAQHFEPRVTVDREVWKEFDQGRVITERKATDIPGRYRVEDKQHEQWREFQDGHLVVQRTYTGRVWQTDAFGRWKTAHWAKIPESAYLPKVGGEVGLHGHRSWRLIGRQNDYWGWNAEFEGIYREFRDADHYLWQGVRNGESVSMPAWKVELRRLAVQFAVGWVTSVGASLAATAAENHGHISKSAWEKALFNATISGATGAVTTALLDRTVLGRPQYMLGNLDWGLNSTFTLRGQTDDWNTDMAKFAHPTRWRGATMGQVLGLPTTAFSGFVGNMATAAVFGVNGHDIDGGNLFLAGAWGAAGNLFSAATTSVARSAWHLTAAGRVFARGSLSDLTWAAIESFGSSIAGWALTANVPATNIGPGTAFPAPKTTPSG